MSAYDVHIATARGSSPSLVVVPAFGDDAPMLACYFNSATRSWSGEVFANGKWKPVGPAAVEDALAGLGGMAQATEIVAAGVREAAAHGKSPARAVEALLEARGITTGTWKGTGERAKEQTQPSRREQQKTQGQEPRKPSGLKCASGKPRAAEVAAACPSTDAKVCGESAKARGVNGREPEMVRRK